MNTSALLYEAQNIGKELKRLRKRTRELNKRKKDLIDRVVNNMRDSGETELLHQGKTYKLEEYTRRVRKGDQKKHDDTVSILNDEGFHGAEAEDMYNKLLGAHRGPESVSYKLK